MLYRDLDAIPSGNSGAGNGALHIGPGSIVDLDPAVISVHSSDSDPDQSDELCQFRPLNGPLSPISASVSPPAEPVALSALLARRSFSAAGHRGTTVAAICLIIQAAISKLEDCASVTLDMYPIYEVSPDTTCYVPATLPVTPPISGGSLPPKPGGPASLDSLLAYDITLLDRYATPSAG